MIVELEPGDPRIGVVFPVLVQLRPHIVDADELAERVERQYPAGYRLAAVFDDDRCVAVAGYRLSETLVSGPHLYVDDLVTDEGVRGRGHGERLLEYLAGVARDAGCGTLELDSGTHRGAAHRFYFRQRLEISSFHFQKALR